MYLFLEFVLALSTKGDVIEYGCSTFFPFNDVFFTGFLNVIIIELCGTRFLSAANK